MNTKTILLSTTALCLFPLTSYAEVPGPSPDLFAKPPYECVYQRYMSPTGNDSSDGTSPNKAWRTIGKADSMSLPAGTCVNLADGEYQHYGTVIRGGGNAATPRGYVVYRAGNLNKAILKMAGNGNAMIAVHTNYVMFDGLIWDGNNNMAAGSCLETSKPSGNPGHHLWAINNEMRYCGLGGISFNNREYHYAIHNWFHHNSSVSAYLGSGLSIYEPEVVSGYVETDMDKAQPAPIVAMWNISNDNNNPQTMTTSDGNGIILDDWKHTQNPGSPYTRGGWIEGNVTYHNGGKGIHCFISDNMTIKNNTSYNNNWDLKNPGTWRAEISVQNCSGVKVLNNIAQSVTGSGILSNNAPYMGQQGGIGNVWENNIAFGSNNNFGSPNAFPVPPNKLADPKFNDVAANDFTLKSNSPAIGFAKGGGDAGAYQTGGGGSFPPEPPVQSLTKQAPATITIDVDASGKIIVK